MDNKNNYVAYIIGVAIASAILASVNKKRREQQKKRDEKYWAEVEVQLDNMILDTVKKAREKVAKERLEKIEL